MYGWWFTLRCSALDRRLAGHVRSWWMGVLDRKNGEMASWDSQSGSKSSASMLLYKARNTLNWMRVRRRSARGMVDFSWCETNASVCSMMAWT